MYFIYTHFYECILIILLYQSSKLKHKKPVTAIGVSITWNDDLKVYCRLSSLIILWQSRSNHFSKNAHGFAIALYISDQNRPNGGSAEVSHSVTRNSLCLPFSYMNAHAPIVCEVSIEIGKLVETTISPCSHVVAQNFINKTGDRSFCFAISYPQTLNAATSPPNHHHHTSFNDLASNKIHQIYKQKCKSAVDSFTQSVRDDKNINKSVFKYFERAKNIEFIKLSW